MHRPLSLLVALLSALLSFSNSTVAEEPKPNVPASQPEVKRTGKTYVLVYLKENFWGTPHRIEVPAELNNDARLKELGIPNDSIMSMKIPNDVIVTLYDNAGFSGESGVFTGNVPTLGKMKGLASSLKAEFKK